MCRVRCPEESYEVWWLSDEALIPKRPLIERGKEKVEKNKTMSVSFQKLFISTLCGHRMDVLKLLRGQYLKNSGRRNTLINESPGYKHS